MNLESIILAIIAIIAVAFMYLIPFYYVKRMDEIQLEKIKEWNRRKELELKEEG